MINDFSRYFSNVARNIKRSEIRELLKFTRQPDIISLAGGLPDPATFPVELIAEITADVLKNKSAVALQYGPTEGELPLRTELAKLMCSEKPNCEPDNMLITAGSQQGLDLISRILLDPGDIVVVELPSYIGALNAFATARPQFVGIPQDQDGMQVDLLEEELVRLDRIGRKPKIIYTIPDFQNPSGVTMSLERRKKLIALAYQYEILIVEDSPYRELRFSGEPIPSLLHLDPEHHVIFLGTFSKIFCPGFRLAWVNARRELLERMTAAKQSMDLSCPSLNQLIAAEYLKGGRLRQQIGKNAQLYRHKCDVMMHALEKYMPEDVHWTRPEGGLFSWVTLPEKINAAEMLPKAVAQKVVYVAGSAFYCDGLGQNTMRINFSFPPEDKIEEGVRRLALTIKQEL